MKPATFVHCPLNRLEAMMPLLLERELQPEICFQGADLDRLKPEQVERLAAQLIEGGLQSTIHGPFHDLNSGALDPAVRKITLQRYRQTLEVARTFQARLVVFHPGYEHWRYGGIVNLWLQPNLSFWPPLLELADDCGIDLALENIFEREPESLAQLIETLDHPRLGHCFDIGHWNLFAETDLPSWFARLGSRTLHLHLHDNCGDADAHLPLGEGKIDFSPLWQALASAPSLPSLTLEAHRPADLETSLRILPQHLAALHRALATKQ